mgnify:CR=1 FL=1
MKYIVDHDLHIHTCLSLCSGDPEQTPARILRYARENELSTVCLTDHFWDDDVPEATNWYRAQNFAHVSQNKPLPSDDETSFLFGCETDFNKNFTLGIADKTFSEFDFVIIPTTHMHMKGFVISEEDAQSNLRRAQLWVERLEALTQRDLPFQKIGIAHLSCTLLNKKSNEDFLETLNLITDSQYEDVFSAVAKSGAGVEINASSFKFAENEANANLRMYRIAKNCGCKFYLGSDAHHNSQLDGSIQYFNRAIDLLGLEESDKFTF